MFAGRRGSGDPNKEYDNNIDNDNIHNIDNDNDDKDNDTKY